ncbi:MAG: hypothetical protein ABSF34_16855 [Verrucomicrobiota bacterium]
MDTLNSSMIVLLSTGFGTLMQWGVPQLILAVLGVLAARRHKLPGLWVIAAAAILSLLQRVALALVVLLVPSRGDSARMFAPLNFYPGMLIVLIAIVGWAMLAFPRTKKSDHDA